MGSEGQTSKITDCKQVLHYDNNKESLDNTRFIRTTLINNNMYNCHITLLIIYLYVLRWQQYLVMRSSKNSIVPSVFEFCFDVCFWSHLVAVGTTQVTTNVHNQKHCTLSLTFHAWTRPAAIESIISWVCLIVHSFFYLSCISLALWHIFKRFFSNVIE